ncbi:hypothetical protein D3C78_1460580 [compost metagenome]
MFINAIEPHLLQATTALGHPLELTVQIGVACHAAIRAQFEHQVTRVVIKITGLLAQRIGGADA